MLKLFLTSSAASTVSQLQQFGIDRLPGFLQDPDQLSGLPEVPRSEKGVSGAFVSAASCTPDAVDIILGWVRVVIVDDKLDILHIFGSRGGARGEEVSNREGKDANRSQIKTNANWLLHYFECSLILSFKMGTVTQTITARHPSSSESITYQSNHRLFVLCTHLENDLTCQLEKQIM